jgi:DNA polymerase III subunit gamma/tau
MTLYRQYRPTRFSELFGQENVHVILQNSLARERLAHAYLFSGPRGTGKTTTARIVARAVTCEQPVVEKKKAAVATYEPCNSCASCLSQLNDHAPDVVEIDAASNRGIEDIRQLREQTQYLPLSLKKKVYIIDEVHMLTVDAFNALLKTLEEPPRHCLFILATTELHKVPATIRSRCQQIRFERGSAQAIAAKLQHIVSAEGWTVEPDALQLIAAHAAGGFRDAETTLEQLVATRHPLTKSMTIEALGTPDTALLSLLLTAALSGSFADTRSALATLDVPDQHRCEQLMSALIEHVRGRLYAEQDTDQLSKLSGALTILLEGYVLIKGSPHPKVVLESSCLEVAGIGQRGIKPGLAAETDSPATAERVHLPTTAKPVSIPEAAPTPAEPLRLEPVTVKEPKAPVVELREVAIKNIRLAWREMTKQIAKQSAPLGQMLREAVVYTADELVVTVHVKYKFHLEKLSEKKNRDKVEQLLEHLTHERWRVHYEQKENMPRRAATRELSGEVAEAANAVFGNS